MDRGARTPRSAPAPWARPRPSWRLASGATCAGRTDVEQPTNARRPTALAWKRAALLGVSVLNGIAATLTASVLAREGSRYPHFRIVLVCLASSTFGCLLFAFLAHRLPRYLRSSRNHA